MMMMDEDMEGEMMVYTVHEIDLDYEFDACKFVDFCKEESFLDAHDAEMWFESAPDYPPSPFVAKLMLGDMSFLENVNVSPKGDVEEANTINSYQARRVCQMSVLDATTRGLTCYNHIAKVGVKEKAKAGMIKSTLPRNSTLMKPTASQMAKQNKPHQSVKTRFIMPVVQTSDRSVSNSSCMESQAPKRQKLDGGQLHKIVDMKQPPPLVHKAPKKVISQDVTVDFSSNSKLQIAIPREPEFVTRQRVQTLSSRNKTKPEQVTPTAYSFRARPLNRKILEAPSVPLPKKSTPRQPEFQEFHLKTAERSVQHARIVPSSSCNVQKAASRKPSHSSFISRKVDSDNERPIRTGALKLDDNGTTPRMFKALPVNKKIFSSKGELGVSRSTKRSVTVPMEFKFETEKRMQHQPPVDLFSKLSLAPELHPTNGNERLSRLTFTTKKDSKENKGVSSQQESEMTPGERERTVRFWPDQLHCSSDKIAVESGPQAGRWLGIR